MTGRLVVGIDGSPASAAAAAWAGQEAALWDADVHLLNVWRPPVSNVQFSPNPEAYRLWEEDRLAGTARDVRGTYPGLTVTAEQASGTPVKVLLRAAATADMLVLGSGGLGRMSRFLLGSVGLPVLAHSERPVVLVRTPEGSDVAGPDVVVGVDLGASVDALMAFALAEAEVRQSTLRVVHADDVRRMYGYAAPQLDPGLALEFRAEQETALAKALAPWRNGPQGGRVVQEVVTGPVVSSLIDASAGAGLLVVGRRRGSLHVGAHIGPVTHGVVHHAGCPVAVVAHD
ncbi:universal stress protein [Actinacidiphila acidipaludis]|uniref:Universal stress protein n=1 Tax=Actinacidiphila acidipaludis TaxID=2873382 RepID=A0ABS7Q017_9ACTN|nr:universal stress protein [Streptomyces acidipaludis]MBY8876241.1 universal stress protein [Streptomyces acidipaludis]